MRADRIAPEACPGGIVILLYDGQTVIARHELDDRSAAEMLGALAAETVAKGGPLDFRAFDGDTGVLWIEGRLL